MKTCPICCRAYRDRRRTAIERVEVDTPRAADGCDGRSSAARVTGCLKRQRMFDTDDLPAQSTRARHVWRRGRSPDSRGWPSTGRCLPTTLGPQWLCYRPASLTVAGAVPESWRKATHRLPVSPASEDPTQAPHQRPRLYRRARGASITSRRPCAGQELQDSAEHPGRWRAHSGRRAA